MPVLRGNGVRTVRRPLLIAGRFPGPEMTAAQREYGHRLPIPMDGRTVPEVTVHSAP